MSSAFGLRIAYLKKYSKVKFSFPYCFLHHELFSHCSNIAEQRGLHQECLLGGGSVACLVAPHHPTQALLICQTHAGCVHEMRGTPAPGLCST